MKQSIRLVVALVIGSGSLLASGDGSPVLADKKPSELANLAARMKPGTFAKLTIGGSISNRKAFVPPSGKGNIFEFTDEAQWNPISREIHIVGGARPYRKEDKQYIIYSEATNSWTIQPLPPVVGFHHYDHAALDPATGDYYVTKTGEPNSPYRQDFKTKKWIKLPKAPIGSSISQTGAIEYFPEMGGLVYIGNIPSRAKGGRYFLFNVSTNSWRKIGEGALLGKYEYFSEYSSVHKVLFFGGGGDRKLTPENEAFMFYKMDATGKVTRLAKPPCGLGHHGRGPVQTIDPATGNLLVFKGGRPKGKKAPFDNPIYEYDVKGDKWYTIGTHKLTHQYGDMPTVAVPIHKYGVIFIANISNGNEGEVYLYKRNANQPRDRSAP